MAERKSFYHFNPSTLTFEKVELTFKDILKRILWLFASALCFAVFFLWISFYLIDSPKEKMLQKENNELREQLNQVNQRLDNMSDVMLDIQDRDDNIYRTIFETDPVPISERYPSLRSNRYDSLGKGETIEMLKNINNKADRLLLQLVAQSRSFDTIAQIATRKSEMLAAIPAIRPIKDMYQISSGFGQRYHPIIKTLRPHKGIDIAAPKGTPVYATADGIVTRENGGSGYGITIIINHGYSYKTLYAHLSKKNVRPGQKVLRGQVIGYVGNTGLSLGPHLHYEVRKNGVAVNPVHYIYSDITPQEFDAILESSKKINQALS